MPPFCKWPELPQEVRVCFRLLYLVVAFELCCGWVFARCLLICLFMCHLLCLLLYLDGAGVLHFDAV